MTRRKGRPGVDPPRSSNDATLPAYLDPDGSHGKLYVMLMKAAEDGKVLPSNPFTLAKSIQSSVGTVAAAYRGKEGNFVLKVRGDEKVAKLKRMTELIEGTKIVVTEHPRLNQCKVVVTCHTVNDLSDEELKAEEALQDQGVLDVKRFRKNGKPISTMILTIRGTAAPECIYFGYDRCSTKPYAQAPLQCYRCFEFGHPKARCSAPEEICRNCSMPHAIVKDEQGRTICQKPAWCLHCNGNHSPTSRLCEQYQQEEEIEKIRGEGKSPREARRIFEERRTQEQNSYAAVAKKSATQARLEEPAIEVLRKELANAQKALKEAQEEIAKLKKRKPEPKKPNKEEKQTKPVEEKPIKPVDEDSDEQQQEEVMETDDDVSKRFRTASESSTTSNNHKRRHSESSASTLVDSSDSTGTPEVTDAPITQPPETPIPPKQPPPKKPKGPGNKQKQGQSNKQNKQ
ncbi:uncharacterized protein LOC120414735 [Culex pipiens pallens]|uniref:uncharacterized protein LOC120414735 n=1 Tax=Culex pipiens pallens TaxID=42434 RepID=UPI0019540A92|nr:uncharacterized protein LOC120414735 [Culex pipiens pallens]